MPRRPRRVIGWVEVESSQDRIWRHVTSGGEPGDRGQLKLRRVPGTEDYVPAYWCAADRPTTDDTFVVKPVYNNTTLHEQPGYPAECQACCIPLAELQESANEMLDAVYG